MIHLRYLNFMNPARPTGNTTTTRGGMLLWGQRSQIQRDLGKISGARKNNRKRAVISSIKYPRYSNWRMAVKAESKRLDIFLLQHQVDSRGRQRWK